MPCPRLCSTATLVLIAASTPGCAWEVIHGNGTVRTDERTVPAFTHASIRVSLTTAVQDGQEPGVILQADENLLGHLVARVEDDELIIDVDDPGVALDPTAPMTAIVTAATLVALENHSDSRVTLSQWSGERLALSSSGSGGLDATELHAAQLSVEHSGSGDVQLKGDTDALHLDASGSGDVDADALVAGGVDVRLSGSGDATVHTSGTVNGTLSGSGDLVIHGGPSRVDVDDSGSGGVSIR